MPWSATGAVASTGSTSLTISIVICTWNRCDILADTVRSVMACAPVDSMTCEVIVIDNASTDATATVLDALEREFTFARRMEPRPGLSNARNTGVAMASGEWVIFLDDDVLVEPDFLSGYARAMREHPDAGFLAGGVIPQFDVPLASWAHELLERHPWLFSAFDRGPTSRPLRIDEHPFGANMAVRRTLLNQFPFSEAFGYRHGLMVPGEETALFGGLVAAGERGYWIAAIPVRHRLPFHRQTMAYLRSRAFGQGRAEGIRAKAAGDRARVPRWIVPSIATLFAQMLGASITASGRRNFYSVLLARRLGQLREHLRG